MRRFGLAALFLLGFGLAGGFSATVVAETTPTTGSTGTATGSTETAPSTTTVPPEVVPEGVRIAGVEVGGLSPVGASAAVRAAFAQSVVLLFARRTLVVAPARLGAVAFVDRAVERARSAAPGSAVRLPVAVRRQRVRSYVDRLARRLDRKPADARLFLRRLRPWITKERRGRALDRRAAVAAIVDALEENRRTPIRLRAKPIAPSVTRLRFGPVIVIRRGSNRLYLYDGMRFWRRFVVATGQNAYPTPLGRFEIVVMARNPWWYPPDSAWARGKKPIPPGPGNPLGTRWMGISSPGVGIHGTPDAASLGYSVSHGCIRMRIPEAEWLFVRVHVGTTVFSVAA